MPQHKGSPLLYDAIKRFVDLCLIQDLSLIWPTETVWTEENLRLVTDRFVVGALGDDRTFAQKLAEQFLPLPPACWKLFADALYVYVLPSTHIKEKFAFLEGFVASHVRGLPGPAEE